MPRLDLPEDFDNRPKPPKPVPAEYRPGGVSTGRVSFFSTQKDETSAGFYIGAIVLIIAFAIALWAILSASAVDQDAARASAEYEWRVRIVEACVQAEQFTREECLVIAGGG